jgi:hypothetical protein
MLTIRQQQMEILARVPLSSYESEMVGHFFKFYPRECERAGNAQVLKLVQLGVARAEAHGYRAQREAGLYVNLMLCLGCDFDRDPQFPWAAEQIGGRSTGSSLARINRAHRATIDYLRKTAGENQGYLARALLRMRAYDLAAAPASTSASLEGELCTLLARFYPEKTAFQGDDAVRALVRHAIQRAGALGISGGAGLTIVTTLMFMLGSGFDHDPMYPWAARALDPANQKTAPEMALYQASMDYLALALADR